MINPLHDCIVNKNTTTNPIWFMRQAGRYLPEFQEIRKSNPNFINFCLNQNLASEITLQPLKRFNLINSLIFLITLYYLINCIILINMCNIVNK